MKQLVIKNMSNISGAFADAAILFPLLAGLAIHTGMNGAILMASAGLAYIFAGLFFKIPMPVQPLKSIVVGALAIGASSDDVRIAGLGIGLFCLVLAMLPVDRLEKYIPRHIIHGIQFSLGVLLLLKGIEWTWAEDSITALVAMGLFVPAAIFVQSRMTVPVLGMIAVLSIIAGVWSSGHIASESLPKTGVHADIIMALLLPQLALTLTNSVIGTCDTAHRYFETAASHVTIKKLLMSIGSGNVIASLVGGLPYCHGSGGLTAHVKAGAKDYSMNLYIGFLLVVLAAASAIFRIDLIPHYPVLLMAALVSITGWYHMCLAEDSWAMPDLRLIILAMGTMVFVTQNMLYGLLIGIAFEFVLRMKRMGMRQ